MWGGDEECGEAEGAKGVGLCEGWVEGGGVDAWGRWKRVSTVW